MFNASKVGLYSARAFMSIIVQAAEAAAVACRASFHQDSATEASDVSVCPTVRAGERRGRRLRDANLKSNPPHRQTDKPDATGTPASLASRIFSFFSSSPHTAHKKKTLAREQSLPYSSSSSQTIYAPEGNRSNKKKDIIAGRSENAQHGRLPHHQTPTQGRLMLGVVIKMLL